MLLYELDFINTKLSRDFESQDHHQSTRFGFCLLQTLGFRVQPLRTDLIQRL